MKNIYIIVFFTLITLVMTRNLFAETSNELSTTAPELIVHVKPVYPRSAMRKNGREGWSKLSLVVNKDGLVSDVLLEDSSGSEDLNAAAIKAVEQWKYKPATENGRAIQQNLYSIYVNFYFRAEMQSVSKRFRRQHNLAEEALENKDYDKFKQLMSTFKKAKYRRLPEHNYLQLLNATYAEKMKDPNLQLMYLNRVLTNGNALSDEMKIFVLNKKFFIQASLNLFREALSTTNDLKRLNIDASQMKSYANILNKIDNYLDGNENFVISAIIRDNGYWSYRLVRNEFSLSNVEGMLSKLEVSCSNKYHVYRITEQANWKLPEYWKNCELMFFGEQNTTFNLTEHPIKNDEIITARQRKSDVITEASDAMKIIELAEQNSPNGVKGPFIIPIKASATINDIVYLNSEVDYRDMRNISFVIDANTAKKLTEIYSTTPDVYFLNKAIEVTGSAQRVKIWFNSNGKRTSKYYFQTQIPIASATQIKVIN